MSRRGVRETEEIGQQTAAAAAAAAAATARNAAQPL